MLLQLPTDDLDAILERTHDVWETLRGSRLFMTGGTGFIGLWLLGSLLWANQRMNTKIQIVVMSRHPEHFKSHFPEITDPQLSFCKGDIRYTVFPTETFDTILHLSPVPAHNTAMKHFQIMDGILWGTRRILDFAVHGARAERFLYVTSGAVYGAHPGTVPVPETCDTAPLPSEFHGLFGNALRMSEQMCTMFHQHHGLNTRIARCFPCIGPHDYMGADGIGNVIQKAYSKEKIQASGNDHEVGSFIYAADLATWLWRILINGEHNRIYNVGSDQPVSYRELATTVQQLVAPERIITIHDHAYNVNFPSQSTCVPDTRRARMELNLALWTPPTQAMTKTARWYTEYGMTNKNQELQRPHDNLPKIFVCDIDGVLASLTKENDYSLASPLTSTIDIINRLFDAGHRIILFTARGTKTGIDWRSVTERQMKEWGVQYHELHFGKPAADYYIDDRMMPLSFLQQMPFLSPLTWNGLK